VIGEGTEPDLEGHRVDTYASLALFKKEFLSRPLVMVFSVLVDLAYD
jgi:hypothetical protein